MSTKSIDIIIIEEEQVKRKPLAEFTLDKLPKKCSILRKGDLKQHFWSGDGKYHTRTSLVQTYLDGVIEVHKLFNKILKGTGHQGACSYEFVTSIPFAYSCPEAYAKIRPTFPKEKADDVETISIGHFTEERIYLSLEHNLTSDNLAGSITHEHGHYLHNKLWPDKHNQADPTMKELMAIFVQEKCNYPREYTPNTPHHRALELLKKVEATNMYQQMTVQNQWDFLLGFTQHASLQEFVNDVMKPSEVEIEVPSKT